MRAVLPGGLSPYPNEADGICGRAEEYYLTFMQNMPDLGENMMAKNMLDWFTILSFYEASGRRMDGEVLLAIKRRAMERMKFLGKLVDTSTSGRTGCLSACTGTSSGCRRSTRQRANGWIAGR